MDQAPAVAFTAFVDVWPRATETEIGATLCAIGAGRTLTCFLITNKIHKYELNSKAKLYSHCFGAALL